MEAAYQDFALVHRIDIVRNFFLGREITRRYEPFKFLDMNRMKESCGARLTDIGIKRKISADSKIDFLSGGEKQSGREECLY